MLLAAVFLGFFGLLIGACFAGGETAFYRIPKLRLKLDVVENGHRRAKTLFWFVNNPAMFVATILVGNNLSNYAVSMAMVLFVGCVFSDSKGLLVDIGSSFVLTPFLFVYGEMFPKHLCLQAPTKMLRLLAPVIISAFWLFLPVTSFLYLLNRITAVFFGKNNNLVRAPLGRQELRGILDEGTKTGVLVDTQRRFADGIFQSSSTSLSDIAAAPSSVPFVTADMKPEYVLSIMRQYNLTELPVYDAGTPYPANVLPTGFVRSIDLEIAARQQIDEQSRQLLQLLQTELPLRSAVDIAGKHSLLTGLILLQTLHSTFGCVVDDRKRCIGFVNSDQICNALLRCNTN